MPRHCSVLREAPSSSCRCAVPFRFGARSSLAAGLVDRVRRDGGGTHARQPHLSVPGAAADERRPGRVALAVARPRARRIRREPRAQVSPSASRSSSAQPSCRSRFPSACWLSRPPGTDAPPEPLASPFSFVTGMLPGCVAVVWLNELVTAPAPQRVWQSGTPVRDGPCHRECHALRRWLVELHTPWPLVGIVAPLLLARPWCFAREVRRGAGAVAASLACLGVARRLHCITCPTSRSTAGSNCVSSFRESRSSSRSRGRHPLPGTAYSLLQPRSSRPWRRRCCSHSRFAECTTGRF